MVKVGNFLPALFNLRLYQRKITSTARILSYFQKWSFFSLFFPLSYPSFLQTRLISHDFKVSAPLIFATMGVLASRHTNLLIFFLSLPTFCDSLTDTRSHTLMATGKSLTGIVTEPGLAQSSMVSIRSDITAGTRKRHSLTLLHSCSGGYPRRSNGRIRSVRFNGPSRETKGNSWYKGGLK
jgi:hypothetical protein